MRSRQAVVGVALVCLGQAACLEPTQITINIETDDLCGEDLTTALYVGTREQLNDAPGQTTADCVSAGHIARVIALPRYDEGTQEFSENVLFEVRSGVDVDAEIVCESAAVSMDCVVARRITRFLPHTPLVLPIHMSASCLGVTCPEEQTCVEGECKSALIRDPDTCTTPTGCDETTLESPEMPEPTGGGVVWRRQIGSVESQGVRSLEVIEDQLVVAGEVGARADFGDGDTDYEVRGLDAFVARYDPDDGKLEWKRFFSGAGADRFTLVRKKVDDTALFMAVATQNGFVLEGPNPVTGANPSLVVARLRPDGVFDGWYAVFEGVADDARAATGLIVSGQYVTVATNIASANSGPPSVPFLFPNGDPLDAGNGLESQGVVTRLDVTAVTNFDYVMTTNSEDSRVAALALTSDGVRIGGTFRGVVWVTGPSVGVLQLPEDNMGSPGTDLEGFTVDWGRTPVALTSPNHLSGPGEESVRDLAAREGTQCVVGQLGSELQLSGVGFEDGDLTGYDDGAGDGYLACSVGNNHWTKALTGPGVDSLDVVTIGPDGHIYVAGTVAEAATMGALEVSEPGTLIASFTDDGTPRWHKVLAGTGTATPTAMVTLAVDRVALGGLFTDTLEFGDDEPPFSATASKAADGFVVVLDAP